MNLFSNKSALLLGVFLAGHMCTAQAEKTDRNTPIHIEADRMNVDDAQHVSTFEGRVVLTQGTLRVTAEKLVVTENAEGNKFSVATGRPASFRQKREAMNEYVEGYGERIEYNTQTDTVNFYVRARVKRGQDDVRGDHIIYSTQTEIFNVSGRPESGRVRATIHPQDKNTPAPPPANNIPNNNLAPKQEGN